MIDAIRKNPQITRNELVILFNRTPESIRHHLEKLTKDGVIKHTGSTKAGEWIILKKP